MMTQRARNLYDHIVATLRKQPDIPVHQPIQAVLLTAKRMGFSQQEAKSVLHMLRFEMGIVEEQWNTLVVACLRNISSGEDAPPFLLS